MPKFREKNSLHFSKKVPPLTIGEWFLNDSKRCQKSAKKIVYTSQKKYHPWPSENGFWMILRGAKNPRKNSLNFSDFFSRFCTDFMPKNVKNKGNIEKSSSPLRKFNSIFQVLRNKRLGPISTRPREVNNLGGRNKSGGLLAWSILAIKGNHFFFRIPGVLVFPIVAGGRGQTARGHLA